MKTTLALAAMFAVALGGGYYWYQGNRTTADGMPAASDGATYTLGQVAAHDTADDCWATIDGGVYDLSAWISEHPGGQAAILELCGKDGTEAFKEEHARSKRANDTLASFKIGTLSE